MVSPKRPIKVRVFLRLKARRLGYGERKECVNLCLIRYSALAFLALIKVILGLDISLQNTVPFRLFHILYKTATTRSMSGLEPTDLAVESIFKIVICGLNTIFWLIQLCEVAKLQQSYVVLHSKNK